MGIIRFSGARTSVSSILKERLFGEKENDEEHKKQVLYCYLIDNCERTLIMLLDDPALCGRLAQISLLDVFPKYRSAMDNEPEPDICSEKDEDIIEEKSYHKIIRKLALADYYGRMHIYKNFVKCLENTDQDLYEKYYDLAMRDQKTVIHIERLRCKNTRSYNVALNYLKQELHDGTLDSEKVVYEYLCTP